MIYNLPESGWQKQTGLASKSIGNRAFPLEFLNNAVESAKSNCLLPKVNILFADSNLLLPKVNMLFADSCCFAEK